MNRKVYYIALTAICLLGAFLAYHIVPSTIDSSILYVKDDRYLQARKELERAYLIGNRTPQLIISLAKIYMAESKEQKAFDLLEGYLSGNSDSLTVWEYLAEQYLKTKRTYDYINALERIYAINKDPKVLQLIMINSTLIGLQSKEVEAAQKLLNEGMATAKEYKVLLIQAIRRDKNLEYAQTILEDLRMNLPITKWTFELMEIVFPLMQKLQLQDEIETDVLRYVGTNPNVEDVLGVTYVLNDLEMYEIAYKIFQSYNPKTVFDIDYYTNYIHTLEKTGRKEMAFQELQRGYAMGKLSEEQLQSLFALSVELEQNQFIENLLDNLREDDIGDKEKIYLLRIATLTSNVHLRSKLERHLSERFFESYPASYLTYLLGDPELTFDERKKLVEQFLKEHEATNQDRIEFAVLFDAQQLTDLSKQQLDQITSLEGIEVENYNNLAYLLAKYKQLEKIKLFMPQWSKDSPQSYAMGLIALKEDEKALEWLNQQEILKLKTVEELLDLSLEIKSAALSLKLAERLINQSQQDTHLNKLARAYLLNEREREALVIYRKLYARNESYLESLFIASIAVAAKDETYLRVLDKQLEQLSSKLTDRQIENLGYVFLDAELYSRAESMFSRLKNEGQDFDHPISQSLLFAWEKVPEKMDRTWIVSQANRREGEEKAKWLAYLLYNKFPHDVTANIHLKELTDDKVADIYFEALSVTKEKDKFAQAIPFLLEREDRLERLKKLGQSARDAQLPDLSLTVYEKAFELNPDASDVEGMIGLIWFEKGAYNKAAPFLYNSILSGEKNPYFSFSYGEILQFCGHCYVAKSYFKQTISFLPDPMKDRYEKSLKAVAHQRLGAPYQAYLLFKEVIDMAPEDPLAKIDLAQLYMDLREYEEAAYLIQLAQNDAAKIESLEKKKDFWVIDVALLRYYKERMRYSKALSLANSLASLYPKNANVFASIADVYSTASFWETAWCASHKATLIEPENSVLKYQEWGIAKEHLRQIGNGNEWRDTDGLQRQVRSNIEYFQFITQTIYLSLFAEKNHITAGNIIDINQGLIILQADVVRYRGLFTIGKKLCLSNDIEASLYCTEADIGGGITWKYKGPRLSSTLALEYHKPDWNYVEVAIADGNRDMASILFTYQATPYVSVVFGNALNRYNTQDIASVATTYSVDVAATVTPIAPYVLSQWFCAETLFTLNYIFDGEFAMTLKKVISDDDLVLVLLDAQGREVHNFYFYMTQKYFKKFAWEGFYGVGFDRHIGRTAVPVYGIFFLFNDDGRVSAKAGYSRQTSTDLIGGNVDSFTLDFKLIF